MAKTASSPELKAAFELLKATMAEGVATDEALSEQAESAINVEAA
jgi:ferritin-like metal-binding protein YciE